MVYDQYGRISYYLLLCSPVKKDRWFPGTFYIKSSGEGMLFLEDMIRIQMPS